MFHSALPARCTRRAARPATSSTSALVDARMVEAATTPLAIATSVIGLLIGLFLTFSGYRLARSLAMLAGFVAGFVIGFGIGGEYYGLVGAIGGGVLLGIVLALVFKFAFRFAGAVVGVFAGIAVATNLEWPLWGLIAAAVVGGVVGLFLNKIAIVSWTAIVGASLAVRSAAELFYGFSGFVLTMEALSILASTILLALVGVLSQMRSLRGEDEVPGLQGSAS